MHGRRSLPFRVCQGREGSAMSEVAGRRNSCADATNQCKERFYVATVRYRAQCGEGLGSAKISMNTATGTQKRVGPWRNGRDVSVSNGNIEAGRKCGEREAIEQDDEEDQAGVEVKCTMLAYRSKSLARRPNHSGAVAEDIVIEWRGQSKHVGRRMKRAA
jgi:hypothetical protein